jgi:hypothetical protein
MAMAAEKILIRDDISAPLKSDTGFLGRCGQGGNDEEPPIPDSGAGA